MNVFLIDGTYELFRHFYALPSATDVDGREVGAVRGVVGSVLGMLEEDVTHLGVATDHVVESFRNALWPGYKTGEGIDPALLAQFPMLEEALEANARAARLRPEEPLARSQLGLCYLKLGHLQEAEEQLKLARNLDPGHFSGPQLTLAEIYRRRRDFAAVVAEIEEFLRYHPDAPGAERLQKRLQVARDMLSGNR